MSAVRWHEDRMVALDLETTGINPREDRIVTAAIVHRIPGARPITTTWVINPGIPVPDEAAAVHSWTTDRLTKLLDGADAIRINTKGTARLPRDAALFGIAAQAGTAIGTDTALVVHNAAYDLTMLETELARHDVPTLSSRPNGIRGVVDPMVIERQWDPYRKICYKAAGCDREADHHECGGCRGGKFRCGGCGSTNKRLDSLCRHYGVVHAGAHDAAGDAVATLRLLGKLMDAWPATARLKLPTLHQHQVRWKREQSDGLRDFWKRIGDEKWREVDSGWPLQSDVAADLAGVA